MSNRLKQIDNLRGLAILFVITAHILNINDTPSLFEISAPFYLGRIGVYLFFIVSGYCIFGSIRKINISYFKNTLLFLIKRFLRLYPLYWLSVIFTIIILKDKNFSISEILYNMTMLNSLFGIRDLQGVYWTLFLEIVFYSLIAFYLIIFKNKKKKFKQIGILFLFIFLLSSIFRLFIDSHLPYGHFMWLTLFILGCYINIFEKDKKKLTKYSMVFIFVISICLLLIYVDINFFENTKLIKTNLLIKHFFSYILSIIVFFILFFFSKKIFLLSFLGLISYPLYLTHDLTYVVFDNISFFDFNSLIISKFFKFFSAIFFAFIVHLTFEQKILNFLRKINFYILSNKA